METSVSHPHESNNVRCSNRALRPSERRVASLILVVSGTATSDRGSVRTGEELTELQLSYAPPSLSTSSRSPSTIPNTA
jgi:hypothetical protein